VLIYEPIGIAVDVFGLHLRGSDVSDPLFKWAKPGCHCGSLLKPGEGDYFFLERRVLFLLV
jgi:hypothetical protein